MRLVSTLTKASLSAAVLMAISSQASAAVDAKLLDMLRANGSINAAQYAELKTELEGEKQAQQVAAAEQSKKMSAFDQKVAWAAKTQIKGDIRLRHESVDASTDTPRNITGDQDRQRIRARLGVYSEINPQVDGGIRVATGSSADARSTNQSLDGQFNKKSIWLDQAYLDYHPTAVPNLHVIGGKIAQPWVSMGDVIWDGDINPEGLAVTYKMPLGGKTELFGSTGYYVLTDNVDGDGYQFQHDLRMYTGQAGVRFAPADTVKVTLGGSLYAFDNDNDTTGLAINGNAPGSNEFQLYEGFGQLDLTGLPLPLSFYGQYVVNGDAQSTATSDKEDTAYLFGVKTKFYGIGLDYNYRDVERNAVVGAFTDSDFGNGFTGGKGHKVKVSYDIDKNFAVAASYLKAKDSYIASSVTNNSRQDVDTLQLDVEAKF
ncbi:putative porin [Pseudomonas sp. UBA4194]|uniref:putative porin n=1 Tax=Pseudomonas sp. UBA4194 TaxID=1947317 RepID=UPI0025D0C88C|nr:putative porin [Pseudomonas sp. UBA4194]